MRNLNKCTSLLDSEKIEIESKRLEIKKKTSHLLLCNADDDTLCQFHDVIRYWIGSGIERIRCEYSAFYNRIIVRYNRSKIQLDEKNCYKIQQIIC